MQVARQVEPACRTGESPAGSQEVQFSADPLHEAHVALHEAHVAFSEAGSRQLPGAHKNSHVPEVALCVAPGGHAVQLVALASVHSEQLVWQS